MAHAAKHKLRRPQTLVTGGAGFLGSQLCDRLIAEGHEVVCLDNLLTGSEENIRHLVGHPRFTFLRFDITRADELSVLLSKVFSGRGRSSSKRLDYPAHLASPASPKDYLRHPIDTLKAGSFGTYHALELARAQDAYFSWPPPRKSTATPS